MIHLSACNNTPVESIRPLRIPEIPNATAICFIPQTYSVVTY